MREVNLSDIILSKLFSTSRTLARSIAQVFIDTFATKHMEAPRDRHVLESIVTHRASQHFEGHVQHILVGILYGSFRTTEAARRRVT